MNLLAIIAALGLEQWRAPSWRAAGERAFQSFVRRIERRFNGGQRDQAVLATIIVVGLPVAAVTLLFWGAYAVHPLLALAFNIGVLYFVIGVRRFSHAITTIMAALGAGDLPLARRALAAWRGGYTAELSSQDVTRLTIERGLADAYRHVFAALFWFVLLPGPAGAVLYRAAALVAHEWREADGEAAPSARSRAAFGVPVRSFLWLLDLIPSRLTALSFAVVGDFEDAAYCWRTQPETWARQDGGVEMGLVLASGAGALGVQLGGPVPAPEREPDLRPELGLGDAPEPEVLPSAIGMVWRALILWLLVILLMTLANLAP